MVRPLYPQARTVPRSPSHNPSLFIGHISQSSGGSSPPPPPQGGYRGPPGPPGGYWPLARGYSEPPPHHGPPYPPGGYWNGPRQGPSLQPRYNPPPPPPPSQNQGYGPVQGWNQDVRYGSEGGPQGYSRGQGGSNNRPQPSQQPPNQRRYAEPPQQQQQFEDRGSRGPSPPPQPDNRHPSGPSRVYSAPANQQPNQAPNRQQTFDDIYGDDYTPPPPAGQQNQPSSSTAGYRNPRAPVESDSDSEDIEMEEARQNLGELHLSLSADLSSTKEKKKNWLGMRKSAKKT
jgi:hypothetical protein